MNHPEKTNNKTKLFDLVEAQAVAFDESMKDTTNATLFYNINRKLLNRYLVQMVRIFAACCIAPVSLYYTAITGDVFAALTFISVVLYTAATQELADFHYEMAVKRLALWSISSQMEKCVSLIESQRIKKDVSSIAEDHEEDNLKTMPDV